VGIIIPGFKVLWLGTWNHHNSSIILNNNVLLNKNEKIEMTLGLGLEQWAIQ
jgi:hypothetical protein